MQFLLLLFILVSLSNEKYLDDSESVGEEEQPPLLLLISFDGFRWDYLENHTLPNFQEYFVKSGVKAETGTRNAFTTVTFPNHWTIATGLYPETHGIVANVMYDSVLNETYYDFGPRDNDTRWFGQNQETVPIWILNQMHDHFNRRSGIMGAFPGSNVPIANQTAFITADYHLSDALNWFKKVDILVDWFLNETNPINLGVLYFGQPDDTGHEFGPYSPEIAKMLQNCDYIVGYLIQKLKYVGLYDRMNIIITSDHGMDTASPDKAINLNDYVNITKFRSYGGLTQINIFPIDPNDEEEIYQGLKNIPHYNVYRKSEVLERLNYKHNVRIGPIVMFGDVGYETFRENKEKFNWNSWKGDHGGDNNHSSMHPVFVAAGPAFKQNHLVKPFNSTDIYILMCTILGLTPATNNGSYENIKDLLVDGYTSQSYYIDDNNNDDTYFAPLIVLRYKMYRVYAYNFQTSDILFISLVIFFLYFMRLFYLRKRNRPKFVKRNDLFIKK